MMFLLSPTMGRRLIASIHITLFPFPEFGEELSFPLSIIYSLPILK